jgi:hypothetical protein
MNEVLDERYTLPNARPPAHTTRIALALHLRPSSSSSQIFLAICVENLAQRKSSNHYARALFVEVIFSQEKKKKNPPSAVSPSSSGSSSSSFWIHTLLLQY